MLANAEELGVVRYDVTLFASGASAVTNCANLRFLVYIFIYIQVNPDNSNRWGNEKILN